MDPLRRRAKIVQRASLIGKAQPAQRRA